MSDVYVKEPDELQLQPEELLKLLKPLYGMSDSGNYWNHTFARHRRDDFQLTPTTVYFSLFTKIIVEKLPGITTSNVDDTLTAGDRKFEHESLLTERLFT